LAGNLTDIELVQGCIVNDRVAQEQLYKQFHGPMASICVRYTRNEHDAVEVLHSGFLKVFKNINRFDSTKASLYTWIRTIMVNTAIDFLRQKNRWFVSHAEPEKLESVGIEPEAVQRLTVQELMKLVQFLPPATQAVFNLYVVDGYTHKEIGQILGISDGTSKWHLSEARRLMQQYLFKQANVV
jgi:RNA polymerase sigma factor (sigma-70 family)